MNVKVCVIVCVSTHECVCLCDVEDRAPSHKEPTFLVRCGVKERKGRWHFLKVRGRVAYGIQSCLAGMRV